MLEGLRQYQRAARHDVARPAREVARVGAARLLHYGADHGAGGGRAPVVFVPSLINPPFVLDLSAERSLLRHLAQQGHDVHLVTWGEGEPADMDLAGHVEQRLLPLLRTWDVPPVLVGYCLGGTLAMAAAQLMPVAGLATIATPWHFSGFPDESRATIAALWAQASPLCARMGAVPMEVLQSGFWSLDPARTVRKYAAFADMAEGSAAAEGFIALEDWANSGAPLTHAAGRDLFETFYAADAPGEGRWIVGGEPIRPDAIPCPILNIVSTQDRIVPHESAADIGTRLDLDMGHVGMIVGGRARDRLWRPLSEWLSHLHA